MLEVAKDSGGCPNDSRTKWCSICDNKCSINSKLNRLWRWEWRPRTWISRTVIFLSMLNVVLAQSSSQSVGKEYDEVDGNDHYSSQWAVHIEGGQEVADKIAAKHNFVNLGKIFENLYHFEHKRLQKRSLTPHTEYHRNLINETQVKWAKQQVVKRRSKRDLIPLRPRIKSSIIRFNDVEWPQMWYLNRGQGLDMNVQTAWQEGISGKGVVVTILDDGLEKTHPDLMANYDPQASYDVNNHDEDPMPRYDSTDSNRHGTRCAGEVAAVANNSLCSVGVAFGASVGGVRMLDGDVTDAVEARSLSLNPQHIDIYSASWGPDDDGKTVDGPGELATRAFMEGVTKGRQGKGSIFVWASGNGGREHDNCNCDGYTNSIWTLSISSATENGLVPWYSEACSSTLATTYSSGSVREKQIVTTDLRHKCTNGHTGTSASAPLAAGICALALEANKDLTWRDMQHIVVRTARPANLKSSDWKVNGVGRNVSHSFGYGLMDASAMVKLARTWKTVPEQHRCEVSAPHVDKLIPPRSKVILSLNVTECAGVNFLEHVQAKISLSSSRRGDLQIYLTSPAGTRSTLLAKRPQDSSRNPFNAWPFMSVHTWGEMPFGTWQLEIHNEGRFLGRANLQEWSLLFYGTAYIPSGISDEKPSRIFGSKSSLTKTNTIHVNSKSSKNAFTSPSYSNRKNFKNWKAKSATSRIGKISNPGIIFNGNGSKISPTVSSKNSKTSPRLWHSNKSKELTSGRGLLKTTSPPLSTHGLPLTLVLGPSGNFTSHQKVPLVFQKYPKVQQLYPLYVNASRMYNEENLLYSKIEVGSSKTHDFIAKSGSKSYISGQKTERQNRFDTSSLTRTSNERKISAKKPPSRNQQNQGHFEGWQMLFYGTEDTPNGEIVFNDKSNNNVKSKLKNMYANKANIEDDVSNHLEAETSNRGWKDQATRRDDVTRTTTGPLGSPSSGCLSYSKPSSQCIDSQVEEAQATLYENRRRENYVGNAPRPGIHTSSDLLLVLGIKFYFSPVHKTFIAKPPKCDSGLYLYEGRCEANCPPATYPATNVKERPACMPCHFTCLMCAGESEAHCTSCHNDSVPTPSGLLDVKESTRYQWSIEAEDMNEGILLAAKPKPKNANLPRMDEDDHLSWGKRDMDVLVRKKKSVFNERAVIKKILEPHNAPRTLYYCYPARVIEKMNSAKWYYIMTVLFAVNLVLLLGVLVYLLSKRFLLRGRPESSLSQMQYRYLKGNNDISLMTPTDSQNILYISSSSDEEE